MKKIIFTQESKTIPFCQVNKEIPIFAKRGNKLQGMIIHEDRGWILRTGSCSGSTGHHPILEECIKSGILYGYDFYIEE